MLSHLRFHRRGPSNPSSPVPDQSPASATSAQSPFPPDGISPYDGRPPSSSSSALPPTLPPITRVTTDETDLRLAPPREADTKVTAAPQSESRAPPPAQARSPYSGDSGFIGGVALRKYERDMRAQASAKSEPADGMAPAGPETQQPSFAAQPRTAPTNTADTSMRPPPPPAAAQSKTATSFITPTDLQNNTSTGMGRRPAGARLTSEPPQLSTTTSNVEPQRGKKGLPFLKNPMSTLLMRRKNSQNVPDLVPLRTEEPTYDPRIRGTRVHDFSAPRRKNNAAGNDPTLRQSVSHTDLVAEREKLPSDSMEPRRGSQQGGALPRGASSASDSAPSGSASAVPQTIPRSPSFSSETKKSTKQLPSNQLPSNQTSSDQASSNQMSSNQMSSNQMSSNQMPPEQMPPDRPAPPVPPKDDAAPALRSAPSKASRASTQGAAGPAKASASTRTTRSRNISLGSEISARDTLSSLPRHMKSTSSRFSFDMIGAAKQEKLLEERHRQREIERQTTDDSGPRDSRFDDFDEDAFDYDAMMDDDGLEERIPGVNADYEEDDYILEEEADPEPDPDDDQENFSGFVFQRSDPASLLASPQSAGVMVTPRDDEGRVIGFAMSGTPNPQKSPLSPDGAESAPQQGLGASASGLGIQGVGIVDAPENQREATTQADVHVPPADIPPTLGEDELYFDDGMLGFEDEFAEELAAGPPDVEGQPFDESIFDNNDTDQFGRPVPGAFAQAQSSRREAQQGSLKRESDMTSRFSAQSGISRSTAHTSLSYEARPPRNSNEEKKTSLPPVAPGEEEAEPESESQGEESTSVAAYQAALAAAAHKAAASGKFQRTCSPPPGDMKLAADESQATEHESPSDELDGYEDDSYEDFGDYGQSYEDMDGFDLDDDAIIAEANASALANDSDGWYGQEFGFYSGPSNSHGSHSNSGSADCEYANGGFFGPKGMNGVNRSTSGRMISREPNLTPITERSEYSNRNSVMSMGMPPLTSGTPIQSPGLAQLAMMGDRGDDQMNLSALLRLRSRAWGGSQASLVSSKDGSPRSERGEVPSSPWGPLPGSFPPAGGTHGRKNSVVSMVSRDSDAGSPPGSPTLTSGVPDLTGSYITPQPMPGTEAALLSANHHGSASSSELAYRQKPQPLQTDMPHTAAEANDVPLSAASGASSTEWNRGPDSARTSMSSSRRRGPGHRHKGSADSVSYMMEEGSGETRWVVERRRTGEAGQVEILEREVVEGGRI